MTGLEVIFGLDQDGPCATLRFRVPGDTAGLAAVPLEVALLLARDQLGDDPVLTLRRLPELVPLVRSQPLPGALFLRLREIWEARQAEGMRVEVAPAVPPEAPAAPPEAPDKPVPVESPRFALDFGGHLARGRAHEVAGRLAEALAEYEGSEAPTRGEEIARVQAALAGGSAPVERLVDEEAVLAILRAIAADGKVDAAEMQTLKALGQCFGIGREALQRYIDRVRKETRPADGTPMAPAEVMRELFRKAAGPGRVGPESSQTLKRAAQALGLTIPQVREIVSGR